MSKTEKEVTAAAAEETAPKPAGPPKSVFREYFESFVVTLIMALFGMTFVIQAVTVPTGSMQNTILVGDYLLVNKFIFAPGGKPVPLLPQREIQRGDIIVFKFPGYEDTRGMRAGDIAQAGTPYTTNFVKRVIGMPGDTVEFRNNQVFINGALLPEHRVTADSPARSDGMDNDQAPLAVKSEESREEDERYDVYYSEDTMQAAEKGRLPAPQNARYGVPNKQTKVPDDSYFVLGDSRDHSLDSRFWGFVHRDLIIGRAMFVYWSCDRTNSDGAFDCITNPRLDRIGKFIK
ncbi:MAG TPA: signal peptidase I [Pyrinomonadaceae bacterium]|nr:signal peptidase I [Pyrinomonadaceae bacterium]